MNRIGRAQAGIGRIAGARWARSGGHGGVVSGPVGGTTWKMAAAHSSYTAGENRFRAQATVTRSSLDPVIKGDRSAIREFLEAFAGLVWWVAGTKVDLKRDNCDREDVYMELWLKVFENDARVLRDFRGESAFSTYLCTVLCRRAIDIARSITVEDTRIPCVENYPGDERGECEDDRTDPVDRASVPSPELNSDRIAHVAGVWEKARAVIAGLPDQKRRFFKAAFVDEREVAELRAEFGLLSDNAVYQWKNRILARIREGMEQEYRLTREVVCGD